MTFYDLMSCKEACREWEVGDWGWTKKSDRFEPNPSDEFRKENLALEISLQGEKIHRISEGYVLHQLTREAFYVCEGERERNKDIGSVS